MTTKATAARRSRLAAVANPLAGLRNVGPAALADFRILGIRTLAQLAEADPSALYEDLQRLTRQRQDPCVRDVFSAAIHQARTGEALDWWHFTATRKAGKPSGADTTGAPR